MSDKFIKCDSYREFRSASYYNPITTETREVDYGICWGTKDRDRCNCKGNQLECDFYPEVREKAKENLIETKIEKAIKLLKDNGYEVFKKC